MPDTHSAQYRKMRDERRELVQLAIEEAIERTGKPPTANSVARDLRYGERSVREDWDYLHAEGKLPARPRPGLPVREAGRNFGTEGGGLLLEAEGLMQAVVAEIGKATPEYLAMTQDFHVAHLDSIVRLAEEALRLAMGTTVDDLIGQITRKEER